jgi:hypothetical protein
MTDMINHPPHYNQGAIECIDGIEASMSAEQFEGYLKGNLMKYVWRYENKSKKQDLEKAEWYLRKLLLHVKTQLKTLDENISI